MLIFSIFIFIIIIGDKNLLMGKHICLLVLFDMAFGVLYH